VAAYVGGSADNAGAADINCGAYAGFSIVNAGAAAAYCGTGVYELVPAVYVFGAVA